MNEPLPRVNKLIWVLWIGLLLSFPVTSFPHFPRSLFQDALVRPLALYPLGILTLVLLLPYILRGGRFPKGVLSLLAFTLVAIGLLGIALLEPSIPLRGFTPQSRALRAVLTLGIGIDFFLVTILMTRQRTMLKDSIKWLYLSLGIALIWALLQVSMMVYGWPEYDSLNTIQEVISVRDLKSTRVSSFAFEPSWFADQLVVVWIPLLLGGIYSGSRIFGKRAWARSLEFVLLLISLIALAFTYSRGGIASLLVSAGLVTIGLVLTNRRKLWDWFTGEIRVKNRTSSRAWIAVIRISLAILVLVGSVSGGWQIFSRSSYFALTWTRFSRLVETGSLTAYLASIGGDVRVSQSLAAWEVFTENPVMGVGLGQSGFYLLDHIPNWTRERSVLTATLLSPLNDEFPNPKNLWIRLLSETGLIGSAFFAAFILVMLGSVVTLLKRQDKFARHLGLAGLMSWIAVLFEGFSLDSFALPTMWIAFGLVTAGSWVLRENSSDLVLDRPQKSRAS